MMQQVGRKQDDSCTATDFNDNLTVTAVEIPDQGEAGCRGITPSVLTLALIHPSAWKWGGA